MPEKYLPCMNVVVGIHITGYGIDHRTSTYSQPDTKLGAQLVLTRQTPSEPRRADVLAL